MRPVLVRCNRCGSAAAIDSSKEISDVVKHLYCMCRNVECGHTFVVSMEFSHTLSPSALDLPEDVRERLKGYSRSQQQLLFSSIQS
ncbi:ogr/Delta-like zinc finger family protein [Desulfovibrio mangrovi]|uniref:ogr/Delta-like zinc finger family protein n=1 Tax=Desulfovibrio mangrovi TaxID=2976983 RepID=UPI0022483422|nr:ogr/Delta-like zinc finger family protein [Desulfovibrio mangrovi]UZP68732.1 ogr/Delta-like zinc finger family protein [Desulfovibrio mangrovi]